MLNWVLTNSTDIAHTVVHAFCQGCRRCAPTFKRTSPGGAIAVYTRKYIHTDIHTCIATIRLFNISSSTTAQQVNMDGHENPERQKRQSPLLGLFSDPARGGWGRVDSGCEL